MEFSEAASIATPVLVVVLGYFLNRKFRLFSSTVDRKVESETRLLEFKLLRLERKLEKLLSPLITMLEIDDCVWQRVSTVSDSDEGLPTSISEILEEQLILPSHLRSARLIQENLHLVSAESRLHSLLISYVNHVAIYKAARESQEDLNPIDLNAPFPSELKSHLREEYALTLKRYNELLSA